MFWAASVNAQITIDEVIAFQSDNAKKYSVYVPSSYDGTTPAKMMVGLHPLNTSRWDSKSWRDTLISFSEENNLVLLCPDGAADGRIDDPIDTAFTTFIIDSMLNRFSVDESKIYLMGFSWGGRTTYSYGLNHAARFAGFMPIGGAMNGISGNESYFANADKKIFYVIHGSDDSPQSRYFPFLTSLEQNGACYETNYLQGVGHTIDFPNRNQILTDAFKWIEVQNCDASDLSESRDLPSKISVFPNPVLAGSALNIVTDFSIVKLDIFDLAGKKIASSIGANDIDLDEKLNGIYTIKIKTEEGTVVKKFEVIR